MFHGRLALKIGRRWDLWEVGGGLKKMVGDGRSALQTGRSWEVGPKTHSSVIRGESIRPFGLNIWICSHMFPLRPYMPA